MKKPEMGDTSDDGDWSWTDSDQDWEGTMERRIKNRERKKKAFLKKKEMIKEYCHKS